jgi:hypothetical protein
MKLNHLLSAFLLLSMVGCAHRPSSSELINKEAALVGDLPFTPLQWKVICSSISRRDRTMATLYGNDLAVNHAREGLQASYPQGSELSLVTWSQQADKHWFGARMPAAVRSVEFVSVDYDSSQRPLLSYEEFRGAPLRKVPPVTSAVNSRIAYILGQSASVMP